MHPHYPRFKLKINRIFQYFEIIPRQKPCFLLNSEYATTLMILNISFKRDISPTNDQSLIVNVDKNFRFSKHNINRDVQDVVDIWSLLYNESEYLSEAVKLQKFNKRSIKLAHMTHVQYIPRISKHMDNFYGVFVIFGA